ncbi:MAG: alpha/beta fold hydrolase [Deltaproteobacteria bacterium]|nr:MAG: alpha/beta fold hydrolase [Deltaproteobacteria bacterium]
MAKVDPSAGCTHGALYQALEEAYWLMVYGCCFVLGLMRSAPHTPTGDRRPVVLICGLLGRSPSFYRLRRHLQRQGHPVYTPDFGWQMGNIERKARQLEAFLDAFELDDFHLIGHSMGGFIVAALGDAYHARARQIITVGTGFGGTPMAYTLWILKAARMMAPGSAFRRLHRARLGARENVIIVRSWWDEISAPISVCSIEGCQEIVSPHLGHIQLVMSDCSIRILTELVSAREA